MTRVGPWVFVVGCLGGCAAPSPEEAPSLRRYDDEVALLGQFEGRVAADGTLTFHFEPSAALEARAREAGVSVEALTRLTQGTGGGRGTNPAGTYELVTCHAGTTPSCGTTYADPAGTPYPIIQPTTFANGTAACGTIPSGRDSTCYAADVELRTFLGVEVANAYVMFRTTSSSAGADTVLPYGGAADGLLGMPNSLNDTVYRYGTLEPGPLTLSLDAPYHQASLRRWRFSFPAGTTDYVFNFAGDVYGTVATAAHAPFQASVTSVGGPTTSTATAGCLSNNGDYQVFTSTETGVEQVFVMRRRTGELRQVSVSSTGVPADGASRRACITPNGRHVVFESTATNLGADGDAQPDIFVRDLVAGTTTWVSTDGAVGLNCTGVGNPGSFAPTISDDGRYVAFHSGCQSFCGTGTNCRAGRHQIYRRDLLVGILEPVSLRDGTTKTFGNWASQYASISGDGRFVAFESSSNGLGWLAPSSSDTVNKDIFVRDMATRRTYRVSDDGGTARSAAISRLGASITDHRVAFYSTSTFATATPPGLGVTDTNGVSDVFRCTADGTGCEYISLLDGSTTQAGNGTSGTVDGVDVSSDGSLVVFETSATNLFAGDTNATTDIILRRGTRSTCLSRNAFGTLGTHASQVPTFAPTDDYVTFESRARNLLLDTGSGSGSFDGSDSTTSDVFSVRL